MCVPSGRTLGRLVSMGKQKVTRRERFLAEMDQAVPWARLVALVKPFYPPGKRGRPPLGTEVMLRVYFFQQWYALADEALEDAIHDSRSMRTFVGGDTVPDATTLLGFRHRLERHDLTRQLFAEINARLAERGAFLREGTIVDATIIAAAPSTKNKAKERDLRRFAKQTLDSYMNNVTCTGTPKGTGIFCGLGRDDGGGDGGDGGDSRA